ncbi:MAG TPA: TIGR03668 family PPOX class F420-dependent oxidoreductase [Actinomycetota bacterium]|nr:TIGR03668 family PPOX class F420-dependent oxidoreductase [Actinomycetota bacterium]
MPSGSCTRLSELPPAARAVVAEARRAVLVTLGDDGAPHAVPVCFALRDDDVVTAVDHKPKRTTSLARVRNVRRDPRVTLLFDRWDDDWSRLGWVMVGAAARVEPPGSAGDALARRYAQYRDAPPRGDVVACTPHRVLWWTADSGG